MLTNGADFSFREYNSDMENCTIKIVTPEDGFYFHSYYDVDPISPSGRYLACNKIPFQDRSPEHHSEAEICVVDLVEEKIHCVGKSKGWGMQTGSHICWGPTDELLYYNDKEGTNVFCIEHNLKTGENRKLSGPIWQISPDGRYIFSPSLIYTDYSQEGYGTVIENEEEAIPALEVSEQEGLWRVDTQTNEKKLIFSIKQAYDLLPDKKAFERGRFVFFHTKINPQNNKIMLVVRCVFEHEDAGSKDRRPQHKYIVTMDMDGGNAQIAFPYHLWTKGSHHPTWCPDGESILMNVSVKGATQFCRFGYDGSSFEVVCPDTPGGGHPSYSNDLRYILTDVTSSEKITNEKGQVPLRLIDATLGTEKAVCHIDNLRDIKKELRCDLHPIWSRADGRIVFNGAPEGIRQVLIADIK